MGTYLLDSEETARYLDISRSTLFRLINQKKITPVRVGRSIRFDVSELDKLLTASPPSPIQVVVIPKIASFSSIGELLQVADKALRSRSPKIIFDLSNCEFLTPTGVAVVCSVVTQCRDGGKQVDFLKPNDPKVKEFLDEIGFWGCLNLQTTQVGGILGPTIQLSRLVNSSSKITDELARFYESSMNISEGVSYALQFAHNELIENVFDHSHSRPGCLVCAGSTPTSKLLKLAVLDEGQGIKSSLSERHTVNDDVSAIKKSVERWVSAKPDRGVGLHTLLNKFIQLNKGELRVVSGRGKVIFESPDKIISEEALPYPWNGTIVEVKLNMDQGNYYRLSSENGPF